MSTENKKYLGQRIYLRPLEYSDVNENYLSWFNDQNVTKFLESKNLTKQEVIDYIKQGIESKTYYMYAICLIENNKHIGNIKIGPINRKHMTSDLVTVIGDSNYWGKGIATESIKIGNKIAFEQYKIRKLSGGMYSDNVASLNSYLKAGWIEEGRLKGHYLINGKVNDRVCVSCFNPDFFGNE